jgi:hypothetical protein
MHPSVRPQLDQEVDARESEVSNASKKTRNLRQGSFVRLRFIRKKIGEGDARNADFASDLAALHRGTLSALNVEPAISAGFPKVMIRLDRSNALYGQMRKPF